MNFLSANNASISALNPHLKMEKSVEFYSNLLNISTETLSLATHKILGLNPIEIISKKLMTEAKWQLAYSEDNITQVSLNLGFDDENSFISFFSANEGVSPLEFRLQYLENLHKEIL